MTVPPLTYDLSLLDRSFEKWNHSPSLRAVYAHIFAEMRGHLKTGSILEIGSGIGMARNYFPSLITSDVIKTRFVDRAVSAYFIPRENWQNIIAIDMLHHLQEPFHFLESAAAALEPGGRLILAEPAGTWWARWFYGRFHHELCRPDEVNPPFRFAAADNGGFANMGIAQALFGRDKLQTADRLNRHGLVLVSLRYRDFLAYPATGGFSRSASLSAPVLRALLAAEHCLPQVLLRVLALRMIIVLEKKSGV